ncbi:MAG: tRNA (adenosine(37)-N6)-threonylcarbamoyltransferase complex ATPase subunit type 1 TsaE [Nitrospinae bacterium]|nr:tRNA (adenosine(37)-N6)-threonylcarbamoyltransferase complex ATPase subunit type 1 TsaE [Nitrospinota bacterium]MBL7019408.1 tRNA (adenosine(37)-N6)-threonylcarbamoyltransferase complex ATPase subunit type 1 TsaE [Nitrospinaceae bacterium]
MKKISHSPEETLQLGKFLGSSLIPGDIILLFGDLGAGKTHLTQGICIGLGLDPDAYIRSPTFTLINEYPGRLPIYHIDLYRIDSQEEIYSLGLEEILFNQGVTVIEWAEKLRTPNSSENLMLNIEDRIEVNIKIISDSEREFTFNSFFPEPRTLPIFTLL